MSNPPPKPDRAQEVLETFFREPMLWPVATVVLLTAMTFGAAILLFAIQQRALVPGIALLVLIFLTVWGLDADIRARRLRPVNRIVLGLWAGSALGALLLDSMDAFR